MKALALGLTMLSFAAAPAAAQPAISEARMSRDMLTLASDAFEGRKPGTDGEAKTLVFLEKAFAEAGLKPGGPQGWLQPVALGERTAAGPARFVIATDGRPLDLGADVLLSGRRADEALKAPVAYGGYGTQAPQGPGSAARGAIVLYRNADQPGGPNPAPTDEFARMAALHGAGAAAVLAIVPDAAFDRMLKARPGQAGAQAGQISLESRFLFAMQGSIRESAARRLIEASGADLAALDAAAASPGFQPVALQAIGDVAVKTSVRLFTSHNVIGRLEGRKAPGEAVLYTAHWDGFGDCRPEEADRICNGGVDNASGTAGLIELARAFRAGKAPDRTILFIATTAEERGLLGAWAYTEKPAVPLNRTISAFNIDTIALYPKGNPVGFVGAGMTTAEPVVQAAVAAQGRKLDSGAGARGVLKSSDAWAFMRVGVPAYILSGAIARDGPDKGQRFRDYVASNYHTPRDEVSVATPLGGAVEDIELIHRVGLKLSTAGVEVDFLPTSPFRRR